MVQLLGMEAVFSMIHLQREPMYDYLPNFTVVDMAAHLCFSGSFIRRSILRVLGVHGRSCNTLVSNHKDCHKSYPDKGFKIHRLPRIVTFDDSQKGHRLLSA